MSMGSEFPPNKYTVSYEDRVSYLHALVEGEADSIETSLHYWNAVAEECRRRGRRQLLVVEDFRTPAPLTDVFRVAEQLPGILRGLRVAFIDREADQYAENMFGETVAVNRGAVGRVFRDEAAAIMWLEE
jgi:hypothetical protein